jgi:hypothetical protein
MRKSIFVVGIIFLTIFLVSGGVSAQSYLNSMLGNVILGDTLMSDWQLDYLRPLKPGDLQPGEFRISPLVGRVNYGRERDLIDSTTNDYDYDNSTMIYMLVMDTAVSQKLTLHGKYLYQPWEKYTYDDYDPDDENRSSLVNLFANYNFTPDRKMYFGYNRVIEKEKNYDSSGDLDREYEYANDIYYLGFEIRGSFFGKK